MSHELKETRSALDIEKGKTKTLRQENYSLTNTVAALRSENTSLTESLSRTTEQKQRYRRMSEASEKANQALLGKLGSLEECKRTRDRLQAKIQENEQDMKLKTKILKINQRKDRSSQGGHEDKENVGAVCNDQSHSQLLATNKRQKRELKQLSDVQKSILASRRALKIENNELRDTIIMLDGHAAGVSVTHLSTTVGQHSSGRLANALSRALQEIENDKKAKPVTVRQVRFKTECCCIKQELIIDSTTVSSRRDDKSSTISGRTISDHAFLRIAQSPFPDSRGTNVQNTHLCKPTCFQLLPSQNILFVHITTDYAKRAA